MMRRTVSHLAILAFLVALLVGRSCTEGQVSRPEKLPLPGVAEETIQDEQLPTTDVPNPIATTASTPAPAPTPSPIEAVSPCLPTPTIDQAYGCPQTLCPRSLAYAVNGCICGCDVYDESRVEELYCCRNGFSDEPCPESVRDDLLRESVFGRTQWEIESQLVWTELQGQPILVHQLAAPAFEQVARAIEHSPYRIVEPVESYFFRNTEGHKLLSTHGYGIAVDINPSTNPSCGVTQPCRCYNDLITDMPPEFIQAFKEAGFAWGGDWTEHPDPMHFEWEGWLSAIFPTS